MRRGLFISMIVAALLLTVGALWFKGELEDVSYCARPPTQEEEVKQQTFVKAHVYDARDFVWFVADCDDQGEAYLTFTTELSATAVSQSFLTDPACSPSDAADAAEDEVRCESETATSYIYEEQQDNGQIRTVLAWVPEES